MTFPNCLLAYKLIQGSFKSTDYIAMLQDKLLPCMKLNYGDKFYFQEDNYSVHKAKKVKDFMSGQRNPPELNIVEHVWKIISDIVYDKRSFHNKSELEEAIVYAITYVQTKKMDTILDLYSGIRNRLCTVLCKQGNLFNK